MPPDFENRFDEMLKYKKQNENRSAKRCASTTMSVYATVSPTKTTTATQCTQPPLKCSNSGDKLSDETKIATDGVGGLRSPATRKKAIVVGAVAPKTDRKADEEDKYPCLRRALSCTETPILPLGTYAVEFGFDVSTLPFVPLPRTSATLLAQGGHPFERVPAINLEAPPPPLAGSKTISSLIAVVSRENCSNHTLNSATCSLSSVHNTSSTSHAVHSGSARETRTGSPLQRISAGDRTVSVSSQTTDEHTNHSEDYLRFSNSCLTNCHCSKNSVTGTRSWTHVGCRFEPVNDLNGKLNERPPNALETALLHKTHNEVCKEDLNGSESKELCCVHGLIAKKWKKDNRTWLWKSSDRKRPNVSDAERPVAKRWKKDERTWLWKCSKKEEDDDDDGEEGEEELVEGQ